MASSKKLPRRNFRFECLETRNLLAGNVTADTTTTSFALTIIGDNSANDIVVTQINFNTFTVTGIGTKVNGTSSAKTFTNVSQGVFIDMGGGNDVLTLKNLNIQGESGEVSLGILLGNGNDALVLSNVATEDKTGIDGGSGNNAISIDKCNFGYDVGIQTYGGNDAVAITHTAIEGGLSIQLGNGTNALSMVSDTVTEQAYGIITPLPPGFEVLENAFFDIDCGAIIVGGSGTDVIAMNGVTIDCYTQIDTAGGNDSVSIVNSQFGAPADDSPPSPTVVEPNVDDPILVDPTLNDTSFGLYIQTGTGNDAVAVVNTTVFGHLLIDTSNEVTPDGSFLKVLNPIKDGNDSVALVKVNVLLDGEAATQTSTDFDFGSLSIYTGNQTDAVSLTSVITDADVFIQTTDIDNSNSDGADAVAIASCTFDRVDPGFAEFGIDRFSGTFIYGLVVYTGNGNDVVAIANVTVTDSTVIETGDGTDHVGISALTETPNPLYLADIYVDLEGGKYNTLTVTNSSSKFADFYVDDHTGSTLVKVHNHFDSETDLGWDHDIG